MSPQGGSQLAGRINGGAKHVKMYEDPQVLAAARATIPIERLERGAQEDAGVGASELVVRDAVLKRLLAWFKFEFFSWTNNPSW